ncbi:basement membrane proteoglycan-like isoform X1 [Carettochelys insculpta]|uniref:basement membrane proteoglycan-like isoform X1 n=1 Tax=Carettochelys insculpta TaxID=44489 RepID=UPI003EB9F71B
MVLTLLPLLAALQLFLQPVFPQGVPAAPSLSVQPPKQEYLAGDTINFRCTAPSSVNGIQGFHYYHTKESTSLTSPLRTHTHQKNLTGPEDGGPYQCSYWTDQSTSNKSNAIYIKMKGSPPWPALRMNPPSRVVSEGLPMSFTCTAPRSAGEQRFHFYKDGEEIIPRDVGPEVKITVTKNDSVRLSISQASPKNAGEFTCAYEENVNGKWFLSIMSLAMNVTVTARGHSWARQLVVGGSFFAINGLIFLISHLCMKSEASKQARTRDVNQYQPSIYSTPDYSSHSA